MLVDQYLNWGSLVWLMFEEGAGGHIMRAGDESVGEMPGWLADEVDCIGWHWMLAGTSDEEALMAWALEHGIAPGQPFPVHVSRPRFWRGWTDYGYDCDLSYDVEVERVEPLDPVIAASRIESWLEAGHVSS